MSKLLRKTSTEPQITKLSDSHKLVRKTETSVTVNKQKLDAESPSVKNALAKVETILKTAKKKLSRNIDSASERRKKRSEDTVTKDNLLLTSVPENMKHLMTFMKSRETPHITHETSTSEDDNILKMRTQNDVFEDFFNRR